MPKSASLWAYPAGLQRGRDFYFVVGDFGRAKKPADAIQLLWLNLMTDGAPALALGLEQGEPDLMRRPPRPPHEPIIKKPVHGALNLLVQTA